MLGCRKPGGSRSLLPRRSHPYYRIVEFEHFDLVRARVREFLRFIPQEVFRKVTTTTPRQRSEPIFRFLIPEMIWSSSSAFPAARSSQRRSGGLPRAFMDLRQTEARLFGIGDELQRAGAITPAACYSSRQWQESNLFVVVQSRRADSGLAGHRRDGQFRSL
jgi:hypothetical protein